MAKVQTFGSKSTKNVNKLKCTICGEDFKKVKLIASNKSDSGNYKFKENMVNVCKCNEKDVYI